MGEDCEARQEDDKKLIMQEIEMRCGGVAASNKAATDAINKGIAECIPFFDAKGHDLSTPHLWTDFHKVSAYITRRGPPTELPSASSSSDEEEEEEEESEEDSEEEDPEDTKQKPQIAKKQQL